MGLKAIRSVAMSGRIRSLITFVALHLAMFTALRAIFYLAFMPENWGGKGTDLLYAWYLGFKFDLRLSLLLGLPLALLSLFPPLNPILHIAARRFWQVFYFIIGVLLCLFYLLDFGNYDYVSSRLNAEVLEHIAVPEIALQMVWESYPVVWAFIAVLGASLLYAFVVDRLIISRLKVGVLEIGRRSKLIAFAIVILLYAGGIYGKVSWYPLRWSDAFFSTDSFASMLSLNPVLFFFDTLPHRTRSVSPEAVRDNYDLLAKLLEVDNPDSETLSFKREVQAVKRHAEPPNIVLIHLESFAAFKTGIMGNQLNATPAFDAIARQGLLYANFHVPRPPTARSVYAALFGIPDIYPHRSVSRNPGIISQRTLLNFLTDYQKFYFLGGSASWGNIRGLLKHNIPGLQIYEEGDYKADRADVWGVSDLHLLEEANSVLSATSQPFFAFVQTAGNHRPYTIPDDNRGFELASLTEEQARQAGFESVDSVNGLRFMDHAIDLFFRAAAKEPYFKNTIFCMYGDHGSPARSDIPYERLGLTSTNVPMVIYAPGLIHQSQTIDTIASSVDLLPTLLGLAGVSYVNHGMGRDLQRHRSDEIQFAFIDNGRNSGILTNEFYLPVMQDGSKQLYRYRSDQPLENVAEHFSDKVVELEKQCLALKECAIYMMYNNKPGPVQSLDTIQKE